MDKQDKKLVTQVIDDLNGLSFKNSTEYSEKEKEFFQDRYFEILKLLPKVNKQDKCLEIGLAGGEMAFILKKFFDLEKLYTLEHPITCTQYKKSFLDKLESNQIILEPVDLRQGRLPWQDNFFDFIMLSEVLEHLIPSDIPGVLKEIKRVLKKDGYLVITTPNIASLLKRINLLRGKNPIEFDLRLHEEATFGHIREYTMNELEQIVMDQNFKLERKDFYMIDSKRNIFTRIEDLSSRFFPPLANNLALIVKNN